MYKETRKDKIARILAQANGTDRDYDADIFWRVTHEEMAHGANPTEAARVAFQATSSNLAPINLPDQSMQPASRPHGRFRFPHWKAEA